MNCPFYGHALFPAMTARRQDPPFLLFASGGNQCALITTAHSPCKMEVEGQEPDWSKCRLVNLARTRRSGT